MLVAGNAVAATTVSASNPCSGTPTTYNHVIVYIMENNSIKQSRHHMPFLDSLAAKCAYMTHEHAITHPSLPNYMALTGGSTFGITKNADPKTDAVDENSVFQQVPGWRTWAQGMGTNCHLVDSNNYVVHHNPAAYYLPIRSECKAWDVPLKGHLAVDLSGGGPTLGVVIPDNCNNAHFEPTCSGGSDREARLRIADNYLKARMQTILNSEAYHRGHTLVIITWDEGSGSNKVYTVLAGPSLNGQVITTESTHYSLLRLIEKIVGVSCLNNACTASKISLP